MTSDYKPMRNVPDLEYFVLGLPTPTEDSDSGLRLRTPTRESTSDLN